MAIIFKKNFSIVRLPLSVFSCFQRGGGHLHSHRLYNLHITLSFVSMAIAVILFLRLPQAHAGFMESMAIDPKAVSLANTVTANPPGIASIHYNPAGLSLMEEGTYVSLGLLVVSLQKTSRFEENPDFDKFHSFDGKELNDPVAGTEGTSTSGRIYIPILDTALNSSPLTSPSLGISHRNPGSKWTFAYSAYAPMAGGWNCGEKGDPSVYGGKSVYMQHIIYAAPSVSYKLTHNLSLGASFGIGQTAMGIDMSARAPNDIVNITKILGDATQGMSTPIFDLTVPMPLFGGGMGPYDELVKVNLTLRDDFSPSYNLGALWEPYNWLALGASYNSQIESHVSGKYSFKYSEDFQNMVAWSGSTAIMQIISMIFDLPYEPTAEQKGTVTSDLKWPQMVNVGFKVKPLKKLSLMADLHWAEWSVIKEDKMKLDQPIQLLQLAKFMGYGGGSYTFVMKRDLNDTLDWSVGLEYEALNWLTLRAGYEKRNTPVQDRLFDLLYALPDMDYYGVGAGIKGSELGMSLLKDIDIDLCIGYIVNNNYTVKNNTSSNMNSEVLGSGVNNPYVGLDYYQKLSIIMAGFKATMPLEVVTNLLKPSTWKKSPKGTKGDGIAAPVDSSANNISNMRKDNKYYFIEDSD
jgi:long-subunit fatty acid transport protein